MSKARRRSHPSIVHYRPLLERLEIRDLPGSLLIAPAGIAAPQAPTQAGANRGGGGAFVLPVQHQPAVPSSTPRHVLIGGTTGTSTHHTAPPMQHGAAAGSPSTPIRHPISNVVPDPLEPGEAPTGHSHVPPVQANPPGGGGGSGGGGGGGGGDGGGSAAPPSTPTVPPVSAPAGNAAPAAPAVPPGGVIHSLLTPAAGAAPVAGLPSQQTPDSFHATGQPLAGTPAAFELNQGQAGPANAAYGYLSRGVGYNLFIGGAQSAFNLPANGSQARESITLSFTGGNPAAPVLPGQPLLWHSNYFLGSQSYADVPNFADVKATGVYPGIDVHYHASTAGQLEYDVVVQPGADLAAVRMRFGGVSAVTTDHAGNLLLTAPDGRQLVQHAPSLYQSAAGGAHTPVSGRFALNGDGTVGFSAGGYDPSRPLVVDPTLDYSSYWGTSGTDTGTAVAVDANGNAFLAGQTPSLTGSVADVFVAQFNAAGSGLRYVTYLGSPTNSADAQGTALAVDPAGNAVVVGTTSASDYPTTSGALQTSLSGYGAGFVTRLNATGDALLYSTYLNYATPNAVAVDPLGRAYVAGTTTGSLATTTGAFQTSAGSSSSVAFVSALTADGTALRYSTYLGGTGSMEQASANAIVLDAAGHAYVAGSALAMSSSSFPTTAGAYQTSLAGGRDAFVTELNTAGSALVDSTLLGGSGFDSAAGIALDRAGNVYVTGQTGSTNFPTTTGAYQTSSSGGAAFVTKLNSTATALVYSTYLGSSGTNQGNAIAVAPDGTVLVAGATGSATFPTLNALPGTSAGGSMTGFLTKFNAAGSALSYSTYLGQGGLIAPPTAANAVVMDVSGNAFVGGSTQGSFTITSGAYQTSYAGGSDDAFVLKVNANLEAPVLTAVSTDTGVSSSDFITNDPNLTLSGTAPASVTVRLYQDSVPIGTTTSNTSGAWSFNYTGTTLADGTYAFTARSEYGSVISPLSDTRLVTVDTTAPTVTLTVPSSITTLAPVVSVQASDLVGIPAGATVTLDVDLNNNGSFTDPGETGYATATLVNGFAAIAVPLSATGTYRIRARVTDTAGNEGTSSTRTFTIGTAGSPWTLTDATIRTSARDDGNAALQLGDLQVSEPLDLDQSPGSSQSLNPALLYNSSMVNVAPIVQATLLTDSSTTLPATITATLTWNGTAQSPVTFSTTGLHPGDALTLAVQDSGTVTGVSRNDWSLSVAIPGHGTATASGTAYSVAEDSSAFGAGWNLSTLNQLVAFSASGSDPAGYLWVYGDGSTRFFQGTSGTLTGPPEDNGTLVVNTGGSLTYTAADGTTLHFNSSGQQTDYVSADGKTSMGYTYTSGLLTGLTALDGGTATLTYSSGLLASISAPGLRSWSTTLASGDLTVLTQPDTSAVDFTYSGHRMTDVTQGTLANHWAYNSAGLLTTLRWGNSSSPSTTTLAAANGQGLTNLVAGSPTASATDALGNVTRDTLDGQGRPLAQRDANGALTQWTRDSAGRVSTETDALGNVTTFARDSLGYVTTETLPDSTTIVNTYQTAFHALLTTTDQNSHTTTYAYDSLGHLLTTTDPLSNVTTNAYSSTTGLLTSSQDPMGRYTTYTYDSDRRVSTVTTQLGTTSYTYDTTTGEIHTITDALTHVTTLAHDRMGRETSEATADGYTQSWSFNSAGLLSSYTDKNGAVTATAYDSFGRGLVASTTRASGSSVAAVTVNTYDNAGRPIAVQDVVGSVTQDTLDAVGRTVAVTDALGHVTRNVYDLDGELTDRFDPTGAHTRQVFNSRGWVTSVVDPLGNTAYTTYDHVGNVTQTEDALTQLTSYTFDADNRPTTVTDALTHTTTTAYWADGRVHTVTDPRGHVTSTTYDFTTKEITTIAAAGTSVAETTIRYLDADGNVIAVKDGRGNTTTYTLDAVNQVVAVTDPLSHTTTTTLNSNGIPSAVTDANSHTRTYTLNALGQRTGVTDATSRTTQASVAANGATVATIDPSANTSYSAYSPVGTGTVQIDADGNQTVTQYDAAGRAVAFTDANGNTTLWEYDRDGNKIAEIDPNGGTVAWTFNAVSLVTGRTDQLGRSETYSYDAVNRLTTELWKNSSGTTVNTLTYSYDAAGNPLTAADGNGTYTMTFDALNRLSTQQDIWGLTLTLGYDAANNLTTEADSLGGSVTNTFNAANERTDKAFTDTSSHALSVHDSYDAAGQQTGVSRYSDATETTLIGSTSITHDNAGRVTEIKHKDGSAATLDDLNYSYNAAGQVGTTSSSIGSSATITYDPAGQVTGDGTSSWTFDKEGNRTNTGYSTTTGNELSTDGTWNYSYNLTGALIQKVNIATGQVWLYSYDNLNHLVEADHKPSSTGTIDYKEQYTYDVLGNRIALAVYATGSGTPTITHFAYDPNGNAWADLTSSNALITRRLYADGVDLVLARIDSSGVAWYLNDLINSVRDIASSGGALLDHCDYSVWGAITSATDPSYGDRYGFTGREFDTAIGLQYSRDRWYDPVVGRWTAQDETGFGAGDSNLYRYVGNQPSQLIDPSGDIWFLPFAIAGIVILAGNIGNVQAPAPGDPTFPGDQNVLADSTRFTLMAQGGTNLATSAPGAVRGAAAGAAFNGVRQGAGNADDALNGRDLRGIDLLELGEGALTGGALGSIDATNPRFVRYPLIAGGAVSGANNLANGELVTGAVDLGGSGYLAYNSRNMVTQDMGRLRLPMNALLSLRTPNVPLPLNPPTNPGNPFPTNAQPGQTLSNIDPNTLQAGRADLLTGRLATQQQLIQQAIARTTPIQVTPDGVIWDGNHGAMAAAQAGVAVTVQVVPGPVTPRGPVTGLPLRP